MPVSLKVLYLLAVTMQIWCGSVVAARAWVEQYYLLTGIFAWFTLRGVRDLYRALFKQPQP